jgi:DNA-binding response OmpR family regulator
VVTGESRDDAPRYDLSELSVLFLEQHAPMRHLMRSVLRELGINKIAAASAPEEAYRMFAKEPVDLILTDWAPTLDGMAFLKLVRTAVDSPDPYVPVIVVTAHTEIGRVYTARDLGMTEFLAEPISAKLLYGRIRAVIENKRPFVRSDSFFGPDRRRKHGPFNGENKRQDGDQAAAASPP